jgi:tetratricopeptide (TPR) repeat protein
VAYIELKQYDKAIMDINTPNRLNPADPEICNLAIGVYSKIIENQPDEAAFYYNRGMVDVELKQYCKAIADYTEAIRLDPDDAGFFYERGAANSRQHAYDQAIADFSEAMRLGADDTWTFKWRGQVYLTKDDEFRKMCNGRIEKARRKRGY